MSIERLTDAELARHAQRAYSLAQQHGEDQWIAVARMMRAQLSADSPAGGAPSVPPVIRLTDEEIQAVVAFYEYGATHGHLVAGGEGPGPLYQHMEPMRLALAKALAPSVPGGATPPDNADTLHWLRGEICDILDVTVGDDQYPWEELLQRLRAGGGAEPSEEAKSAFMQVLHYHKSAVLFEHVIDEALAAAYRVDAVRGAPPKEGT
jgi:hypothetical protein